MKSRGGVSSTPSGLEELAEIVQSSGLSGSGLLERSGKIPAAIPAPAEPSGKKSALIGAIVGGVIVMIVGIVAIIVFSNRSHVPDSTAATPAAVAPSGPAFDGTALSGDKIIYLLDRGDATAAYFPALKTLTLNSVKSLGPDKKFEVILWDNGSADAYPGVTTAYASGDEIDKLTHWFDNVSIGRSSDVIPSLKLAIDQSPDTIVLATGKSMQLDDTFASSFLDARGTSHAIIDTFSLGDSPPDDPLRKIASATGGKFTFLKSNELNAIAPAP